MISIDDLNTRGRADFVVALRPLFEAAEPLANALYAARPFESYTALLQRAQDILEELPEAEQVEVVNAHPRIGANPSEVSAQSYREQGYDRELALDAAEVTRTYAELETLNREYEGRFGFRFVVFVDGRPKSEIVRVLRRRLSGTPDAERRIAMREMLAIARDRLRRLTADH
jgi:OHCU decarboxylase